VELRILRRLFSPEEAELATHLTLIPEEARVIARRARKSLSETSKMLDEMARKGLMFNIIPKKGPALYTAAQFVIGICEYHVNDLDPELIRDMNEYIPALVAPWEKSPQLRTIPVGRSIAAELHWMWSVCFHLPNPFPHVGAQACIRAAQRAQEHRGGESESGQEQGEAWPR
jgi:Na+-translocating ferredoxin:NAD+ oxidoreductase subunit B